MRWLFKCNLIQSFIRGRTNKSGKPYIWTLLVRLFGSLYVYLHFCVAGTRFHDSILFLKCRKTETAVAQELQMFSSSRQKCELWTVSALENSPLDCFKVVLLFDMFHTVQISREGGNGNDSSDMAKVVESKPQTSTRPRHQMPLDK